MAPKMEISGPGQEFFHQKTPVAKALFNEYLAQKLLSSSGIGANGYTFAGSQTIELEHGRVIPPMAEIAAS